MEVTKLVVSVLLEEDEDIIDVLGTTVLVDEDVMAEEEEEELEVEEEDVIVEVDEIVVVSSQVSREKLMGSSEISPISYACGCPERFSCPKATIR